MANPPRVAYFPDTFYEINGVAHTSRHFEAFAARRDLPFLCVRAGSRAEPLHTEGNRQSLELPRGAFSFALEKDLRFDAAYLRHAPLIARTLREFRPDLIHITGPSEVGMLGAALAHHLELPLVASWHTNVHEYAAQRAGWFLRHLPQRSSQDTGRLIEEVALAAAAKFYSLARILFAPNRELCALLAGATGRPCHLMPRGVDTELFSPLRRTRAAGDRTLVLGFVGRLSVEKNVALLAAVHDRLLERGFADFRFLIVGHGAEQQWLREHLAQASLPGVLRGVELARAYADMDLFVFPSHTDTFGNVVLEAMASGVPAIVTPDGGPRSIVEPGRTGIIADDAGFPEAVLALARDEGRRAAMGRQAREYALGAGWDSVFEGVYARYAEALELPPG